MKVFSFVLSVVVFFVSLYYFIVKVPNINTLNDIIYIALLCILMAICIVGVIVNWEIFDNRSKRRIILFVANAKKKNK
jgi:membrane protein DedA with SNARE-associated domain